MNNKQPFIVFNGNNATDYKKQYGVGKGVYYIVNVSINNAFTVLNHDKEQLVYIVGDDTKKFTKIVGGREYSFYYGNVFLHVIDNFGMVSIFLFNHGYAGGKYMLLFEICSVIHLI